DISGFQSEIYFIGFPFIGGSGNMNTVKFLNNTLHGATVSSNDDYGIFGFGNGKNLTNVLYQGNEVYNLGGHATGVVASGTGIDADGVVGGTLQYNKIHDTGANQQSCGGAAGFEAYTANNIVMQFNEAYNIRPSSFVSGCDWDGFDIDGGVTNSTFQYNYSHDNFGPGFLFFAQDVNGYGWGPNTMRFNVAENNPIGLDFSAFSLGGTAAVINVYNN